MNDDLMKSFLGGAVRHALTMLAGSLVSIGVIKGSYSEAFVGAGMVIAGVAWSWWQKYGQALALAELGSLTGKVSALTPFKRPNKK